MGNVIRDRATNTVCNSTVYLCVVIDVYTTFHGRVRQWLVIGQGFKEVGPKRMPRARNLKPSFFTDEDIGKLKHGARLLFQGLWILADRDGRLRDSPEWIKAHTFPYERAPVDAWLNELQGSGFITRYSIGDKKFIQVRTFSKHQTPHIKEPASTIPALGSAPDSTQCETHSSTYIEMETDSGRGNPQSGRAKFEPPTVEAVAAFCAERKNSVDPQAFVDFYISKGWKVGNQAMKDWQAAVRTWERNSNGKSGNRGSAANHVGPGQRFRAPPSG